MFETAASIDADGHRVIAVRGDVDLETSDALVAAVQRVLSDDPAAKVVVDLTTVAFLDSSGVRALLRSRSEAVAGGGSLSVTGAQGLVADVLRITAVDEMLA